MYNIINVLIRITGGIVGYPPMKTQ